MSWPPACRVGIDTHEDCGSAAQARIRPSRNGSIVLDLGPSARSCGLLHQGPFVADDEMDYYASQARAFGFQIGRPLIADSSTALSSLLAAWIEQCRIMRHDNRNQAEFVVPVMVQSHWCPLALRFAGQHVVVHGPTELLDCISPSHCTSDRCLPMILVHTDLPKVFQADCGFQTLNWIIAKCAGHLADAPMTMANAMVMRLRECFAMHLSTQPWTENRPQPKLVRLGGTIQPDQLLLQALLKQHGVHQERLGACATSLIQH